MEKRRVTEGNWETDQRPPMEYSFDRLVAAALAQRLVQPSGQLSPWGYELQLATAPLTTRFRMSLWAFRRAILSVGAWLVIRKQVNLDRLRNSLRKRCLASDQLARSALGFPEVLI